MDALAHLGGAAGGAAAGSARAHAVLAQEGQGLGISHYLAGPGEGLAKALELTFFPELFQVRTSLQAAPPAELG